VNLRTGLCLWFLLQELLPISFMTTFIQKILVKLDFEDHKGDVEGIPGS
jgi:hypothetical protein